MTGNSLGRKGYFCGGGGIHFNSVASRLTVHVCMKNVSTDCESLNHILATPTSARHMQLSIRRWQTDWPSNLVLGRLDGRDWTCVRRGRVEAQPARGQFSWKRDWKKLLCCRRWRRRRRLHRSIVISIIHRDDIASLHAM